MKWGKIREEISDRDGIGDREGRGYVSGKKEELNHRSWSSNR